MHGQQTFEVDKSKLLTILKDNLEKHTTKWETAHEKWGVAVIHALALALADAKEGKEFKTAFHLPEPTLHAEQYEDIIGLLELSNETTIEIDQSDYSRFVKDEWNWSQQWTASNAVYLGQEV